MGVQCIVTDSFMFCFLLFANELIGGSVPFKRRIDYGYRNKYMLIIHMAKLGTVWLF